MKLSPTQIKEPFVDDKGKLMPNAYRWMTQIGDSLVREVTDTANPPSAPVMKKGEMIVLKATGVAKTYLVYYDGTNRYYWEATGKDLY